MDIDNENYGNETAFIEGMQDIIMGLIEIPLREMIAFCIETSNARGLHKLMAVLKEFRYENDNSFDTIRTVLTDMKQL